MNGKSINRVELQGRVGTVRIQSVDNQMVASFSLATEYAFKLKDGAIVSETTWSHICGFESRDVCLEGLSRGMLVHLTGRLRTNRYTAADGTERSFTEVVADSLKVVEE